jgi:histidine ammonia-lyase
VAQALDFLAVALTTLQAISERRVERLVNPDLSQGLPAFLTADPGLNSGFMMVQITAASLVAESRTLCMPASIGSIPTDANQEDFVPMGMAAAFKARRVMQNAQKVLAAEFLCAAQGIDFLQPLAPGRGVSLLHRQIRQANPPIRPLEEDRPPAPDLAQLAMMIAAGILDPASQPSH